MNSQAPIGVFDSGLGGLSVLKALTAALPSENFVYLGDVARLPYGTKSGAVVTRYALSCQKFLLAQNVKLVVVACNTASATALDALRAATGAPVFGVIEPGVRAGLAASRSGNILVLGTESTIKSDAYRKEFLQQSPTAKVTLAACPLLVPLAEEGWFDHPVTREVITTYLSRVPCRDYDTVVLGCTHYPLLEPSFRHVVGARVELVHSGEMLATEVKQLLETKGAIRQSDGQPGHLRFFSTDTVSQSLPMVRTLFDASVTFELTDL